MKTHKTQIVSLILLIAGAGSSLYAADASWFNSKFNSKELKKEVTKLVKGMPAGIASGIIYSYIHDKLPINIVCQGHFNAMNELIDELGSKMGLNNNEKSIATKLTSAELKSLETEYQSLLELNKTCLADYQNQAAPAWKKFLRSNKCARIAEQFAAGVLISTVNLAIVQVGQAWLNGHQKVKILNKQGNIDTTTEIIQPNPELSTEYAWAFPGFVAGGAGTIAAATVRDAKVWSTPSDNIAARFGELKSRLVALRDQVATNIRVQALEDQIATLLTKKESATA
jgi:hypothetical protein